MPDVELRKGQNATLPPEVTRLRLVVTWEQGGQDVDASALLLGEDGRVRSDEDFVFYNQPSVPDGSVTYLGGTSTESGSQQGLAVDLEGVRPDVTTIAVTASVSSGSFDDLAGLRLLVLDAAGEALASHELAGLDTETALLLGEVYRRGEGWKVRAVGQGWSSGLAGLAQAFAGHGRRRRRRGPDDGRSVRRQDRGPQPGAGRSAVARRQGQAHRAAHVDQGSADRLHPHPGASRWGPSGRASAVRSSRA